MPTRRFSLRGTKPANAKKPAPSVRQEGEYRRAKQSSPTRQAERSAVCRSADNSGPELKATTQPTTAPTAVAVAPRAKDAKNSRRATKVAAMDVPLPMRPHLLAAGDRSLIRALGLKIGRIVVDAGHGGHDTGTIGPNGLMEKDLVLDVALAPGPPAGDALGRGRHLHARRRYFHPAGDADRHRQRASGRSVHLGARQLQPAIPLRAASRPTT